jgi:hypothetical protein
MKTESDNGRVPFDTRPLSRGADGTRTRPRRHTKTKSRVALQSARAVSLRLRLVTSGLIRTDGVCRGKGLPRSPIHETRPGIAIPFNRR